MVVDASLRTFGATNYKLFVRTSKVTPDSEIARNVAFVLLHCIGRSNVDKLGDGIFLVDQEVFGIGRNTYRCSAT